MRIESLQTLLFTCRKFHVQFIQFLGRFECYSGSHDSITVLYLGTTRKRQANLVNINQTLEYLLNIDSLCPLHELNSTNKINLRRKILGFFHSISFSSASRMNFTKLCVK